MARYHFSRDALKSIKLSLKKITIIYPLLLLQQVHNQRCNLRRKKLQSKMIQKELLTFFAWLPESSTAWGRVKIETNWFNSLNCFRSIYIHLFIMYVTKKNWVMQAKFSLFITHFFETLMFTDLLTLLMKCEWEYFHSEMIVRFFDKEIIWKFLNQGEKTQIFFGFVRNFLFLNFLLEL